MNKIILFCSAGVPASPRSDPQERNQYHDHELQILIHI